MRGAIPGQTIVRTASDFDIDECYCVTSDGKLEGVDFGTHSGEEGIFTPEEILSGERIEHGWSIQGFSLKTILKNSQQ